MTVREAQKRMGRMLKNSRKVKRGEKRKGKNKKNLQRRGHDVGKKAAQILCAWVLEQAEKKKKIRWGNGEEKRGGHKQMGGISNWGNGRHLITKEVKSPVT